LSWPRLFLGLSLGLWESARTGCSSFLYVEAVDKSCVEDGNAGGEVHRDTGSELLQDADCKAPFIEQGEFDRAFICESSDDQAMREDCRQGYQADCCVREPIGEDVAENLGEAGGVEGLGALRVQGLTRGRGLFEAQPLRVPLLDSGRGDHAKVPAASFNVEEAELLEVREPTEVKVLEEATRGAANELGQVEEVGVVFVFDLGEDAVA